MQQHSFALVSSQLQFYPVDYTKVPAYGQDVCHGA